MGSELWIFNHTASYGETKTNSNLVICGGTPEYTTNNTHYVALGRDLGHEDVKVGRSVVLLGHGVAEELFPWTDPLLKTIKIDGRKFTVVGVLEDKSSSVGAQFNQYLIIPISTFVKNYGLRDANGNERSVNITVRARTSGPASAGSRRNQGRHAQGARVETARRGRLHDLHQRQQYKNLQPADRRDQDRDRS